MIKNYNTLLLLIALFIFSCNQQPKPVTSDSNLEYDISKMDSTPYLMPPYDSLRYTDVPYDVGELSNADIYAMADSNCHIAHLRMDAIIDSLKILYAADTVFLIQLEQNQKDWWVYLESLMKLEFPDSDTGSSTGICYLIYKQGRYNDRIRTLNLWLMGTPQGFECTGPERILDYSYSDIENYQAYLKAKQNKH